MYMYAYMYIYEYTKLLAKEYADLENEQGWRSQAGR
jgi:hypothetical protein